MAGVSGGRSSCAALGMEFRVWARMGERFPGEAWDPATAYGWARLPGRRFLSSPFIIFFGP